MARGTTLAVLVDQLRAEIHHSTSSAVGQERLPQLQQVLRRTQEVLYDDFDWHFMKVRDADKATAIAQRYYDFPTTINPDRVQKVLTKWGDEWIKVDFGIDSETHYNSHDSAAGEKNDPVENWDWFDASGSQQFEIWPMPATVGTVRFVGIKPLAALVADADQASLDDRLIVLFAAAELRSKHEDARVKASLATSRLNRLRSFASKRKTIVIGSHSDAQSKRGQTTIRISGA